MRVLIVARCKEGRYAPFITEQVDAIKKAGVDCQCFGFSKKGILGYLRNRHGLKKAIESFQPDLIHAHYGLCGLLANSQRRIPVITTYHGSDINNPRVLRLSRLAIDLSAYNIFVSRKNIETAKPKGDNYSLIPCGINLGDYSMIDRLKARESMGLRSDRKYVLFSGAFDNQVKNAPLAKNAVSLLPDVELLELKGYTRQQVATLMQAVDTLIMTSFTEGSPQVIKEALACGCPVVSVDVGDVREMTTGIEGCFLADRTPASLAENLQKAFDFGKRTGGRSAIFDKGLTNDLIATKLLSIYNSVFSK